MSLSSSIVVPLIELNVVTRLNLSYYIFIFNSTVLFVPLLWHEGDETLLPR